MEETIIEIPEQKTEGTWEPPILSHREASQRPGKQQSCADVFFAQYVICILLLTAVFLIKLYEPKLYETILEQFTVQISAPDEEWAARFMEYLKSKWS